MTDTYDNDTDPESIDTGRPISALRGLEEEVSDSFMGSLNRRIQRRLLATDVGRLGWNGPIRILMEILSLVFSIGAPDPGEQKE